MSATREAFGEGKGNAGKAADVIDALFLMYTRMGGKLFCTSCFVTGVELTTCFCGDFACGKGAWCRRNKYKLCSACYDENNE